MRAETETSPRRFAWTDATRHPAVWLGLAAVAFAAQQIAVHTLGHDGFEETVRRSVFLGGTLILIGMALAFRRFAVAWLVAAGIAMNALPMMAHGGLMPVAYETVQQAEWLGPVSESDIGNEIAGGKDVVLHRDDIHFELLSDRYELDVPGYGPNIYSIGDFVLFAGIALAAGQGLAMLAGAAVRRTNAAEA
jgi:hypothetical protein